MGINYIIGSIVGVVMMVVLGTQIAPSFLESSKIAKVENRTISNQELIKDSIVRYIKLEKKVPNSLNELIEKELLKEEHKNNFFDDTYSFKIDKKGTLKIYTKINDGVGVKYFENTTKFKNSPSCILENNVCNGNFETFYLLDNDIFEILNKNEIEKTYSVSNLGEKKDKNNNKIVFENGDKDYVIQNFVENEEGEKIGDVVEYVKNNEEWKEDIVRKNVVLNNDKITFSENKIFCNGVKQDTINFVQNHNGIGEIIYVTPNLLNNDNERYIKSKFAHSDQKSNYRMFEVRSYEKIPFNNMCTSNLTNFDNFFYENTWDVRSDIVYYSSEFSEVELENLGSVSFVLNFDLNGENKKIELNYNLLNIKDSIKDSLERFVRENLELDPFVGKCEIDDIECLNSSKLIIKNILESNFEVDFEFFRLEDELKYEVERIVKDKNIRVVFNDYEEDFMNLYFDGTITNLSITEEDQNKIINFVNDKKGDIINIFKEKSKDLYNFHDVKSYKTNEDYSRWDLSNIK